MRWYTVRWQVLVICLIIVVGGWYYVRGRFWRPVGEGPAGPEVPGEPFQHSWSERDVMIIGLGDSITDGYGAPRGQGYFDLVIENNDSKFPGMKGRDLKSVFKKLRYANMSVSYTTSKEHLTRHIPQLAVFPKGVLGVVMLTTGGNDLIHNYGKTGPEDGAVYGCAYGQGVKWGENFRVRLKKILDGISKKFPGGGEIFLANVYDPTDGVGDIENAGLGLPPWPDGLKVHGLFNKIIEEECELHRDCHLVDIYSTFLGHGLHCRDKRNKHYRPEDPHYWYYVNLEDPNHRGYDAIRRIFLLKMIKVFAK